MDQDSSNGAGPDKRNWRERLGIGPAEMPKLSDEFREEGAAAGADKPAPRAPQPVAKPAPMAPRRPQQPAAPAAGAAPSAPPQVSRATAKLPDNATQEALAEKLRAQRAAAEKLAEQRVQAARNRAEGKAPAEPPPLATPRPAMPAATRAPAAPARPAAPVAPRVPGTLPPPSGGRPKFSFADEPASRPLGEPPARPGLGGAAPLAPPRPALGGERGQPPFLRPSVSGGMAARPPASSYRSGEATSGYGATPPRLQPPAAPRAGLNGEAPAYPAPRVPARRAPPSAPAFDPYARQPESRDFAEGDYPEEGRQVPRLGRPVPAARGRAPQDSGYDEVFEDEAPSSRQRATARDYQAAYREDEGAFGDERRRSSGPWLLLLALLAAALATGAVVWFYSGGMKNIASGGGSSSTVPVVASPEDPSKVAPEGTTDSAEAPAAKKKQIYDRIVGEQEVTDGAQVTPTEETPVSPGDAQPVDQVPKVEPSTGATQIPAPDATTQGTTGQGLPDVEEPPPLPVPPPANGQEGSLTQKPLNQVASAAEQTVQGAATPPPPLPDAQQTSSSATSSPPPPEKATDGAALVSDAASASDTAAADASAEDKTAEQKAAEQKAAEQQAAEEKAAALKAAEKKKAAAEAAAKKKAAAAKKKATDYENLGTAPVVLVPPAKNTATAQPEIVSNTPPAGEAVEAPAQTKKKTIFDLFGGSGNQTAAAPQAETQVAAAPQRAKQATAPAAKQAAVPQQASTGGGYVAQLASFRSEAEAREEYLRLKGAYPAVVGALAPQIRAANVGGSTRYQLALGPVGSRAEASSVCSSLISAGESDSIVRGP